MVMRPLLAEMQARLDARPRQTPESAAGMKTFDLLESHELCARVGERPGSKEMMEILEREIEKRVQTGEELDHKKMARKLSTYEHSPYNTALRERIDRQRWGQAIDALPAEKLRDFIENRKGKNLN